MFLSKTLHLLCRFGILMWGDEMKKILLFAAVFLALFTNAQAKPGDKAGYIYATDIRTYINGIEVPSYNIGGKTVIIAEDTIADCTYSEQLRTLFINPIDKYNIIGGSNASSRKSGTIVGRTYETDIKAYMFDSRIPSYNIGGKTAVAIEDIGDSGEFSDFGARYFYDDTARTLNAEFMCDTRDELFAVLKEKHASVNIDENLNGAFSSAPISQAIWFNDSNFKDCAQPIHTITSNGECIGYYFHRGYAGRQTNDDGSDEFIISSSKAECSRLIFDCDKVRQVLADFEVVQPTMEQWIEYYKEAVYTYVIDEFDGSDYKFLYLAFPNSHGASQGLIRIGKDGSCIRYDENFASVSYSGNKHFDNVEIDREKEIVKFHYAGDYVIDLKTGMMTKAL